MKIEKMIGKTVLSDPYNVEWKVVTITEDGELVKLVKKCGSIHWTTPDELETFRVVCPERTVKKMRFIDAFAFFLLGFTIGVVAVAGMLLG
jgi:phage-related protein